MAVVERGATSGPQSAALNGASQSPLAAAAACAPLLAHFAPDMLRGAVGAASASPEARRRKEAGLSLLTSFAAALRLLSEHVAEQPPQPAQLAWVRPAREMLLQIVRGTDPPAEGQRPDRNAGCIAADALAAGAAVFYESLAERIAATSALLRQAAAVPRSERKRSSTLRLALKMLGGLLESDAIAVAAASSQLRPLGAELFRAALALRAANVPDEPVAGDAGIAKDDGISTKLWRWAKYHKDSSKVSNNGASFDKACRPNG